MDRRISGLGWRVNRRVGGWTDLMKGGHTGWRVDRRVGEWIDELENRYMDWRVATWVGDPFLTFHFCPKSLKRSFSTNISPISKTETT